VVKELLSPQHDSESALGNLFADVTLEAVPGADAAVLNGGSLRAMIPVGPLTYGRLYEAMPFDNRLASIRMFGKDLVQVLEHHLAHDQHGIVSLAGLRLEARCEGGRLRVVLRRPSGRTVRPDETLTIATSDYLATGGDQLFAPAKLEPGRIQPDLGMALREAMAARLSKRRSVEAKEHFDSERPRMKLPSPRPLRCE
jgi:5'-nucleotidase